MSGTCSGCPATWTGKRMEHCNECHQTFTGQTAGDMHRTGRYDTTVGPDRRRCLSLDEMRDKGMSQNKRGTWTTGAVMPTDLYKAVTP